MLNFIAYISITCSLALIIVLAIYTMTDWLDSTDRYNKSNTVLGQWEDDQE